MDKRTEGQMKMVLCSCGRLHMTCGSVTLHVPCGDRQTASRSYRGGSNAGCPCRRVALTWK